VVRKQSRKEDKEKKKQEVMDRKAENKAAYEQEMSSLKSKKAAEEKAAKVSRFQINETIERQNQSKQKDTNKVETMEELPIEENVNRLVAEDNGARSVEDAIALLRYWSPFGT
jgi:hypothetical protein